jgi:hypothetical protein
VHTVLYEPIDLNKKVVEMEPIDHKASFSPNIDQSSILSDIKQPSTVSDNKQQSILLDIN